MTVTLGQLEQILAFEISQVGYTEQWHNGRHPWTMFGAWIGGDGVDPFDLAAWCAAFQSYSHYAILGYSPFPATSARGSASCFAIQQWAIRNGQWVDGDEMPHRHDLVLYRWAGDDIVHHIAKVIEPRGIRRVRTVGGNEGNAVRLAERNTSAIMGYLRIPHTVGPPVEPPKPPPPPHKPPTPPQEIDMSALVKGNQEDPWFVTDGVTKRWIKDRADAQFMVASRATVDPRNAAEQKAGAQVMPTILPQTTCDRIPLVGAVPSGYAGDLAN